MNSIIGHVLAANGSSVSDHPYYRFDGKYPIRWPNAFRLPESLHILKGTSLEQGSFTESNYHYIRCFGIVRESPANVLRENRAQLAAAGWAINDDRLIGAGQKKGIATKGKQFVQATPPKGSEHECYILIVNLDEDMDGWTVLSVSYNFD